MDPKIADAIGQLTAAQSPKRRSAARQLRKMRATAAGPALLAALEQEVQDRRTWETQYQMIMALGECGHSAALPTLERLAADRFDATMVYVALGDAIVRLSRRHDHDAAPVLRLLMQPNTALIDGAFQAMAMLRMVPDAAQIGEILAFVRPLPPADSQRFWVAAAAPGWKHADLDAFLVACETSGDVQSAAAAKLARTGKYQKWSPA